MRAIVLATLSYTLLACAPVAIDTPVREEPVQYLGVEYRRLGERDLRSTIVGATAMSRDVMVGGDNAWRYDPRGRYWNFGHRGASQIGRYWIMGDLVCHQLAQNEWCTAFYKSRDGQFLRRVVTPFDVRYSDAFDRVTITSGVTPYPWK